MSTYAATEYSLERSCLAHTCCNSSRGSLLVLLGHSQSLIGYQALSEQGCCWTVDTAGQWDSVVALEHSQGLGGAHCDWRPVVSPGLRGYPVPPPQSGCGPVPVCGLCLRQWLGAGLPKSASARRPPRILGPRDPSGWSSSLLLALGGQVQLQTCGLLTSSSQW